MASTTQQPFRAKPDTVDIDTEPGADATTAVVAHGLLQNLTVIRTAARMLASEPTLTQAQRDKLTRMLEDQVQLMQDVLTDLVQGLPSQALAALDELSRRRR